MKQIWNTFCKDALANKKENAVEMEFEKDVVRTFLSALGWSKYFNNLDEQKGIYGGKDRPDFVLHTKNNNDERQIAVELKRTGHKQKPKDVEQLERYLKTHGCRFGIYFGGKLEVFYRKAKGEDDFVAISVIEIDYTPNNPAAEKLLNLIKYDNYNKEEFTQYCLDNLELNNYVKHWQSEEGKEELYKAVIDTFKLSTVVSNKLRSVLKFQIINIKDVDSSQPDLQKTLPDLKPIVHNENSSTWLICYDNKSFDVEKCFKKFGQIYWKHKAGLQNVKKGDIAYLYANSPTSAIRYKIEVVESQIPFSIEMEAENEFSKKGHSNSIDEKYKFFLVRPLAETNNATLKLTEINKAGLIGKRPATTMLSKEEFKPLKQYIEQHFNDASTKDKIPYSKPKKIKNVTKRTKKRKNPEPPFKFSMIGLKPGDMVVFDSLNLELVVASDNTISYKGKEYRLTTFCKEFLPENMRTKTNTYQGPNYFSYQSKTLAKIRKEKKLNI